MNTTSFKTSTLFLLLLFFAAALSVHARQTLSFNEGWEFKKGPFAEDVMKSSSQWNGKWESVTIPHTWNAQDMQTRYDNFYEGAGYYRKHIDCPAEWKDKRVFLRFEGVGACAEVYVNQQLVGTHRGGYSAFIVEIGAALKSGGSNEIIVRADNQARPDVIPVNHVLFGVYGGIYRPVWLIVTEKCGISLTDNASSGVYITQEEVSKRSAQVRVKVKLDNATLQPAPLTLTTSIFTHDGKQVATNRQDIRLTPQGTKAFTADFRINKPHLWQARRDPYLYRVQVQLQQPDGKVLDEVSQPLGLRKFELIAGKGFYLNDEKYPMYGVCRHQDWWGLGSALRNEHHDFDLQQIMELGATTVRFAHYQQSEYLYSRCDSLGLIIWAEIPFVNRVTGQEAENAHQQLRELIRQNFNHPSIYVWGLHNEVYQPHAYTSQLTASLHDLAKTEDPHRYTVSVNGYGHMEHPVNLNADIQAMNRYYGWYEKKIKDIDAWIEGLEKNYPDQLFMLSEYGADANIQHQTELLGESLKWWEQYYPETFQTKVHEYHWSVIAKHPYILASYLWNSFDFATPMANRGGVPARNMKGLTTFDRKTRKDSFYWYKANWSEEPVVYLTQRRNTDRERKITSVTVYSNVGTPKVTLNGRTLEGIRQGYTAVHYVFDQVELDNGENVIKAVVNHNGKDYTDEILWKYSGEKNRGIEVYENKNVHSGF